MERTQQSAQTDWDAVLYPFRALRLLCLDGCGDIPKRSHHVGEEENRIKATVISAEGYRTIYEGQTRNKL